MEGFIVFKKFVKKDLDVKGVVLGEKNNFHSANLGIEVLRNWGIQELLDL